MINSPFVSGVAALPPAPPGPLMTSSPKSLTNATGPCLTSFVGRKWLFREIQMNLTQDLPTNGGVIIYGSAGTGKTELMKAIAGLGKQAWIHGYTLKLTQS